MKQPRLLLILPLLFSLTFFTSKVYSQGYQTTEAQTTGIQTMTTKEMAIARVKEYKTPSEKTIGEIIDGREDKTINNVRYGSADWTGRRMHKGQFVLVICTQKTTTYESTNSSIHKDGSITYQWLYDGQSISAVNGSNIDDGLPRISRAKAMREGDNAPPTISH